MQKHTSSLNAYTNCFSCLREMWWVNWDGGQWVGGGEGGGVGGVVWDRGCPCCACDLCLCLAVGSAPLLSSILGMPYALKLPDAFRRARRHRRAARPGPIGLGMVLHRRVVHF